MQPIGVIRTAYRSQQGTQVSTLVVKDRVLAHNPAAALHSSYHLRRPRADQGG